MGICKLPSKPHHTVCMCWFYGKTDSKLQKNELTILEPAYAS